MSMAAEKANLARIRDNQRRSRARRKEYLQELEARLRQCELQGIEASSEIQMAARGVANENKKLRALLLQNGITEDSIETYLHASPSSDTVITGQHKSSSSVQMLENQLRPRKRCIEDDNAPQLTSLGVPSSRGSSVSTVNSGRESTDQKRPSLLQPLRQGDHMLTPSTSDAASRTSRNSLGPNSGHAISHHQRMAPLQRPHHHSSVTNPSSHDPQFFDYETQLDLSKTFSHPEPLHSQGQYQRSNSMHHFAGNYHAPAHTNANSCIFATDMITTMAGGDPNTVTADLGCVPGVDCEVDNHMIFDVMDRYSGAAF